MVSHTIVTIVHQKGLNLTFSTTIIENTVRINLEFSHEINSSWSSYTTLGSYINVLWHGSYGLVVVDCLTGMDASFQ